MNGEQTGCNIHPASDLHVAAMGLAWLSQYGCSPLLRLVPAYGPDSIWRAPIEVLGRWGVSPKVAARFDARRKMFVLEEAIESLQRSGCIFVPFGSAEYPPELGQLSHPPAGVFVRGSRERLQEMIRIPRITVVGTRRSSPYGERVAGVLTEAFAESGVLVVSGLALGIDALAHRAALEHGVSTAAILGCGSDVVYPARHRRLYERIVADGLVISEFPPGTPPARWTFPQRNRLLAALGDAVLVIEGSRSSGALQTAGAALELGRPVFAVPGSILGTSQEGCNWLIYDGAVPAIDPAVTVEEFLLRTRIERGERQPAGARSGTGDGPEQMGDGDVLEGRVLAALAVGPRSVDQLVLLTASAARDVTVALAELQIRGMVGRSGGDCWTRAP